MNKAKLRNASLIIIAVLAVLLCAVPMRSQSEANADMGPKPSVKIEFIDMPEGECYGTLIGDKANLGPHRAVTREEFERNKDGKFDYAIEEYGYDLLLPFFDYVDKDDFMFYLELWNCGETKNLNWNYYPPQRFKIVLYFPESGTFAVSEICERYAFSSHFRVDMHGTIEDLDAEPLTVKKNYDYFGEILALICRILITLGLEILIALPFRRYRQKRVLVTIAVTNIFTNVALNIALNVVYYMEGSLMFAIYYLMAEFAVFLIEAITYCIFFRKAQNPPRIRSTIIYAFIANVLSFGCGILFGMSFPSL